MVLLESHSRVEYWNIKVEKTLENRRIKFEKKNKDEIFNFLFKNTSLRKLITKIPILSDHENIIFWKIE